MVSRCKGSMIHPWKARSEKGSELENSIFFRVIARDNAVSPEPSKLSYELLSYSAPRATRTIVLR